jgi:hypothetical protein
MSYSTRPGYLVSYATGREYPFTPDRDGASRKAAEAQLKADDSQYRQAMQSRAGREVSSRELMAGRPTPPPDLRSVRAQVEQDGQLTATAPDPNRNPWQGALDSARKMIARLPADRSRKAARIAMYEAKFQEWEQGRQREREHEEILARPDVVQAIDHASKRVDALMMDTTASQDEIDAARGRLDALRQTGDVMGYQTATRAADVAKLDRLKAEREQAEATLADLRNAVLAGEVKLDQLPTPAPEQPAAEQP